MVYDINTAVISETATSTHLTSQEEVQKQFVPILKEGNVYRKSVTSYIRKAKKGEHIVTSIDGKIETQYDIQTEDMWVVCGKAAGETYCITDAEFRDNYEERNKKAITVESSSQYERLTKEGYEEYPSNRKVLAWKVNEQDMEFFKSAGKETKIVPTSGDDGEAYFIAPWGESTRVEVGDYLVMQYPFGSNNEIYRIENHVFHKSYESVVD